MNDAQFERLHEKVDTHVMEVDRFHDEVASVSQQIANCDKLLRLANSSLSQIDDKIDAAVKLNANARQIADSAGKQAGTAATTAAAAAVSQLVGAMQEATEAARATSTSLHIAQLKTGGWVALYAGVTLLCCLATGYITSWVLRGNALTPEQANYVELGKAHETLLANASDKELKQISAIRNRPAKPK